MLFVVCLVFDCVDLLKFSGDLLRMKILQGSFQKICGTAGFFRTRDEIIVIKGILFFDIFSPSFLQMPFLFS